MKATLLFLLAALVVASAADFQWIRDFEDDKGEVGKGCCAPSQWEGRVGAWHVTRRFLRFRHIASDSKIGLDTAGKKVAARSTFYCRRARKTFQTQTIADYRAKKVYFIFKKKCKTFPIRRPMRRPCIPDSFRKFGSYFYGAGSSSLALSPYGYYNGSVAIFAAVTRDSCVPIKGAYRVKRRFSGRMGSYQYYNITVGNKDRDLYTVPDFCHKSNATKFERPGMWRRFKKYMGYSSNMEKEFNADNELASMASEDALTQMMNLIDGSAANLLKMGGHKHGWKGWWSRSRDNREPRDD